MAVWLSGSVQSNSYNSSTGGGAGGPETWQSSASDRSLSSLFICKLHSALGPWSALVSPSSKGWLSRVLAISVRPTDVRLTFNKIFLLWLEPMAKRLYCGQCKSLTRSVEDKTPGKRCHTLPARTAGPQHHCHIQRGVSTNENALLSSQK